MQWNRVYDLPDFVYFDHSIHVAKGVGCTTCHGQIDEMRLTSKANTLHMAWCLDCHKAPQKFLREKVDVFSVDFVPPSAERRLALVQENNINVEQRIDCSICHR